MGIFSRLSDIVNSNINAMLDRAEDPERIIRLIIQEMEDTLVEVRSSAVKAIAEKKEIERRVDQLRRERDDWERKAEFALSRGREDLAKGALVAKAKLSDAAQSLEEQLIQLEATIQKTSDDIAKLQAKLNDAKLREKALVERQKSAAQRYKVKSKIYDDRISEAFSRFEQVERNLDHLEGKVEALDLGRTKTLADEFAELESQGQVDEELAALKARMAGRKSEGAA